MRKLTAGALKHSRGADLKVLTTLLLASLRNASIITLAIVVTVPAAVSTALTLGADLISEQASILAGQVSGTYLVVRQPPTEGTACLVTSVTKACVAYHNTSVKALVFKSTNTGSLLKFFGARIIRSVGNCRGVSVGVTLARTLNATVGDKIKLSINGYCINATICSIHTGGGVLQASIIAASGIPINNVVYLCPAPRKKLASSILESADEGVKQALLILSAIALASYAPIMFVGFRKFATSLTVHAEVLREAGAPTKVVRWSFTSVCMVLALMFAIYGIALGTVFLHLGVWAVRFLGIYLALRPAPHPLGVVEVLTAVTVVSVPASYLATKVWGFEG